MADEIEEIVDELAEQIVDGAQRLGISPQELVSRVKIEVEARGEA